MAPLLKPVKVAKGEYVFLKGDVIDGIYFIKKGQAAYIHQKPVADQILATVHQGAYFGDIDFTQSDVDCRRLISIKALTDMELLFLEREDLFELDTDFKEDFFSLFQYSHENRFKLLEMESDPIEPINRKLSLLTQSKPKIYKQSELLNSFQKEELEIEEGVESRRSMRFSR